MLKGGLGFRGDTPERIARGIRTVQQETLVDLLEFFILTPLNKYDLEHVTNGYSVMTAGAGYRP